MSSKQGCKRDGILRDGTGGTGTAKLFFCGTGRDRDWDFRDSGTGKKRDKSGTKRDPAIFSFIKNYYQVDSINQYFFRIFWYCFETLNWKLEIENSKSNTRNRKLEIENSKSNTRSLKIKIENSKSNTRNRKIEIEHSESKTRYRTLEIETSET